MASKKFIALSVQGFDSCRGYFDSFVKQNSALDPKYSLRFFSSRLDWPRSLISDVIAGRKNLSVERAVQFARSIGLSAVDTELLVCLALKESTNDETRSYFETVAKRQFDARVKTSGEKLEPLSDPVEYLVVLAYLLFKGKVSDIEKMSADLYTWPDLTPAKINKILTELQQRKLVTRTITFVWTPLTNDLERDVALASGVSLQKSTLMGFAENICRFSMAPQGPFFAHTGIFPLRAHLFDEYFKRSVALRNWLDAASRDADAPEGVSPKQNLFQVTNTCFPVVKASLPLPKTSFFVKQARGEKT